MAMFALAVRLLYGEIQSGKITWDKFTEGLTSVPPMYLVMAAFLIALNYGLLVTYDLLALPLQFFFGQRDITFYEM